MNVFPTKKPATSNERVIKRVLAPVTGSRSRRLLIAGRDAMVAIAAALETGLHRGGPPSFLIVGAQKAGTTFLYQEVTRHPKVGRALTKEVHFFDYHYQRGLSWYQGFFPGASAKTTGEATPNYLFHPHAIDRIARDLPAAKLVILLRDPVKRAYSQYLHETRLGFERAPSFEEALALEPGRLDGELERMEADDRYRSYSYQHHSYRARGLYLEQVRKCYALVGRQRVLVLRSEDLFETTKSTLATVFEFLGLRAGTALEPGVNDMAARGSERIDPRTETELREFYRPHNERLVEYLGWSRGWER